MTATSLLTSPFDVRQAARSGALCGPTANLAPGFIQANLAILPQALAYDFLLFCQRNPKPCPLVGVSETGDPMIPALGRNLDIRTDLPRYRVWQKGELVAEPQSVEDWWRDDLVSFLIGCSFSFEEALLAAGIGIRHIEEGCNVPMFRTSIETVPAGRFSGPVVVSMRPMSPKDAVRAVEITSRLPAAHGSPIHIGDPAQIGIADLSRPDYGDAVSVRPGEVPVFWACGVTPQAAIARVKPEFCITHAPGHMLVTDIPNASLM